MHNSPPTPTNLTRRGFLATAGAVGAGAAGLGLATAHADDSSDDTLSYLRTVLVKTPADLETAITSARPGDRIMMKNGTWRDLSLEFRAVGTPEHPITLQAQVPGKVIISGTSYLKIIGDHLTVDGLTFRDGAAPLNHLHLIQFSSWDQNDTTGTPTQYSNHCRLTNVVVDRFNKEQVLPGGKDVWVGLWGHHNRVDHCAFLGKTSYALLMIGWRPTTQEDHHRIDNNYFSDIPNNHYSAAAVVIRLGDGHNALYPAYSIIERNVFENMEGIGRIVSLKSSNSTIRDNTFWKASGSICSRAGSFNTVERNFIFEGMETNNGYYTGGMLMIGEGHVIRGNYVQGCRARGKAALQLYAGDPDNAPGVGTYYPTKNVLIENNTFVDNAKNIILNMYYNEDKGWTIPVENITYRENAIVGDDDSDSKVIDPHEVDPIGDIVYEGNQFWGGNLEGLTDIDGIAIEDPGLVEQADGTYQYSANSKLRHNISTRPLTKADVGPVWSWR